MYRNSVSLRHTRLTALFLLPLLLAFGGGEWALRTMPNAYSTKAAGIAKAAPRVETLLLGASHMLMGVRPDLLETEAYSLAGVSQTFDIDCDLLEAYLPALPRLRNVVACADAAILFDPPLCEGEEKFRCTYYNLYLPTPRYGRWPRFSFETAAYTGVRNKVGAWLNGDVSPHIDRYGWYDGYIPDKKRRIDFSVQAAHECAEKHYKHGAKYLEHNRARLQRLYTLCRQHGLRFVLIATPTSPHYAAALPAQATKAADNTLHAFKGKAGALVLDYSRDARFTETDFFDTDHLSTDGAAKFTRILRTDAKL